MTSTDYWVTNLMLADAIARRYGLHRASAVKRCAKRAMQDCDDEVLSGLLRQLMVANVPQTIEVIDRCWGGWKAALLTKKPENSNDEL